MEIAVGISGASGAAYSVRFLQALNALDEITKVHLVISTNGFTLLKEEMSIHLSEKNFKIAQLVGQDSGKIHFYNNMNFYSPIASGSYPTAGMVVIPCSTGTLGAIASGATSNLIQRGAEVALKERKKTVLVIREAPLSLIHLENCVRVTQAGGVIIPASPGFYHRPAQISDLIDFVVARVLDQFQLKHNVGKRWGIS
jgi:4-hydroxy-3-polyprenylbenzoate decarboxylase